ncbi:holin family protein [Carboxylicivirga sediminis]|uniref:Holin family protein n=1 Tax=Carboxylicivirga sediminis TaxID=2006564 RepID=A0A941F3I5_9BACT|nr:holin family protein [Carboxylicivirga sediminis]MBR8535373.1 holin family protein [Carboxylicivirga sediminis]
MILNEVVGIGSKIIDKLFPDKSERDKAKVALLEMEKEGELRELETRMSAIIAEAKSQDKWTSRARPSFMYVFYMLLLFSIPMGILAAFQPEIARSISAGIKAYLEALPSELWYLFGTGYLGYSIVRTKEKKSLTDMKDIFKR